MLHSAKEILAARAPRFTIWKVIREIAAENERRPGEWSTEQWKRFCDALETTTGEKDQIAANPLRRTYLVAKDMLNDGLAGADINTALRMIAENNDREWQRKHMQPAAPLKLARDSGPRRKRVEGDE